MSNLLYYLASPYTHKDNEIRKWRADKVTEVAVNLLVDEGLYVFAPIAYNCHWEKYTLPGDWGFWEKFDKCFIDHCDAIIVLQLEGWDKSTGVSAEIAYAKEHGKQVFYLDLLDTEKGLVYNQETLKQVHQFDTDHVQHKLMPKTR